MPAKRKTTEERFWKKVKKGDGCWLWTGAIKPNGYGVMTAAVTVDGKWRHRHAHRVAYELHNGPIPEKAVICHTCDNRSCVNPAHLWLGTQAKNMRDMVEKGRSNSGEKHWNSKLTEGQVSEMRKWRGEGMLIREIASKFGISKTQTHRVVTGKRWRAA